MVKKRAGGVRPRVATSPPPQTRTFSTLIYAATGSCETPPASISPILQSSRRLVQNGTGAQLAFPGIPLPDQELESKEVTGKPLLPDLCLVVT